MYAESIIEERLSDAAEVLGWQPEYHSIEEVDKFTAHLQKWERFNSQNQFYFSRNLTPQEARFITNEQVLCMCDAAYYLTRYAYLADETDTCVRFKFRSTQQIYFHVISQLEALRAAIEIIAAKGRQVYFTTIIELLVGHRVFFHNDTNALTASADATKSEEMGKKLFFAYDHLQWWLKPKYTRRVEGVPGLLEFGPINSRVSIQHGATQAKMKGAQRVGLGRGGTRTVWHVSEASAIPKPEEQIEASLLRATHASPKVFGNVESTFAGSTGWFAEKYKYAKEHRNDGLSRLTPIFFNWPCAHEIYPTKTWINTHPVPFEWAPVDEIATQIHKAELFIRNDPLLSEFFGHTWVMPIHQQWFYHVMYTEAKGSGTLGTLMQEMPCDDIESMVSSFDSVFSHETIEVMHDNRQREFDAYMVTGQSIEDKHEPNPDWIDYNRPTIPIIHDSNRGEIYKWNLVPLNIDPGDYQNLKGNKSELDLIDNVLIIYKHPHHRRPLDSNLSPLRRLGVGVDTGSGQGYDYSAISVTEAGDGTIPDVQVAEWRSNKIGHVAVFPWVMAICLYFVPPDKEIMSYPLVAIEQLTAVGDVCQKEMKRLGYPGGRFFNFGRYDTRGSIKQLTNKQGWFTTGWSRPILVDTFIHLVENGWYIVNSPWTIEECRAWEVHETASGKRKEEHSHDTHDDAIFASAISVFILHDMDTLASRSKKQSKVSESLPQLNLTPNSGYTVSANEIRQATMDEILEYGY